MASTFTKLGAWFLKDSGKKFVFGCATVGSISLATTHIFSQVFFINQYRDLFQSCRNGFSIPIPQPLMQRVEKTMGLLELNDNDKSLAKPFITIGFEIFSAGSFWSRFGTIIGLPINFTYIDTENVNTSSIRLRDMSVEWDLPEGKSLLKSMTLSEKAQMYAIAKHIELRRTLIFYYELFTIITISISAYAIGNSLNVKLNLFQKPRSVRLVMYSLVGSFATINYLLFKDFGQIYFEEKVDDYLVNKNEIFKEGGVEYYSSILNRNIALRKLMGKVGESKFTALGNENNLIRTTHSPLVQRKLFFEEHLQSS